MAVIYWDPEVGDDSNPGTADAPVATLNQAASLAGAGGEIRCAGRQLVNLGTATFTYGSTSVTFDSDPSGSLAAGDVIIVDGWPMEVSGVSGTSVTLRHPAYLQDGSYQVYKAIPIPISTVQTASNSYPNITVTFGWDFSTEMQPADWATCISLGAAINDGVLHFDGDGTTIRADGRLYLINNNNSYDDGIIAIWAYGVRITGVLAGVSVYPHWDPIMRVVRDATLYIDEVRQAFGNGLFSGWNGQVTARRAILWNTSRVCVGQILFDAQLLELHGTSSVNWVQYGSQYHVDRLVAHSDITSMWSEMDARAKIRRVEGNVSGISPNVWIGSPLSLWRIQEREGIVDKAAGSYSDAGGYSLRMDPAYPNTPLRVPLRVPGVEAASITVSFYAYCSGTGAPACWLECNGQIYEFSPPNGTGWADAVQVSLTVDTSNTSDTVELWLCATDNAAQDALVYISDITITAPDGTEWTVLMDRECLGLEATSTPPPPQYQTPLTATLSQQSLRAVVRS